MELLGPNDLFGDDLIFGVRRTYPLTIEAVTNSKVVFVSRDVLMSLLYEAPAIMQNFLSILSDRVQQQNRRILLLSQKSLRQKISNYLLDLLREQQEKEGESPRLARLTVSTQAVELPVSKVVSRLLAMPRPSFSRELISMERDGLIRVSGRVIWLTDLDRLEKVLSKGFNIADSSDRVMRRKTCTDRILDVSWNSEDHTGGCAGGQR